MKPPAEGSITACLAAMNRGDAGAQDRLWNAVYQELRDIAGALMARERPDHVLQTTALVNECYARIAGAQQLSDKGRAYFFAAAAQAMRRILIEQARRRVLPRTALVAGDLIPSREKLTIGPIQDLGTALEALAQHDQRVHEVVMLRYFAGRSVEQTADVLNIAPRTVKRCWAYGRVWLLRRLSEDETPTE